MQKKKLGKEKARKEILDFFKNLKDKSQKDVKKIKRVAMHYNIKLGNLRKKFCKKCYSTNLRFKKVKRGIKTVICKNCGSVSRWKLRA